MTVRGIGPSGLHLKHADNKKDGDVGPQMIRLNLLHKKTEELLQQLRDGKKVTFQTGKQPAVHYGKDKLVLDTPSETFPADMYTRADGAEKNLYFSGKFSLHLEMVHAQEATAKVDAALANLQNSLSSIKESRNETTMLAIKPSRNGQLKPMQARKDQLLGSSLSRPSSPFLGALNAGPTSVPQLGSSSTKDKVRREAMKIPVIHLLASKPMSPTTLAEKIRAPLQECEGLLNKIARDSASAPGKKELKDKGYRELDVWRFPYAQQSDRDAAVEHAIHALDRMRVDRTDNLWQMLLKPEDRGKGRCLSRLNFDRPAVPPKAVESGVAKNEFSDAEANPRAKKTATSGKPSEKKTSLKEPAVKSRAVSPAPVKKRDVAPKSTAPESKFKSAERIEDSDEEAGPIVVMPKKAPTKVKDHLSVTKPSPSHSRQASPAPKKPIHKPSTSSSSSDNSDNSEKKSSLKPPAKEGDSLTRSKSPRPRHGSSPQKPSPLGSSPPANSTDFDSSSSTTTKGTSQSSVPSSPDSDMPLSKQVQNQKYSPVVRGREAPQAGATKRKHTDTAEAPPAKRHQVNGVHTPKITHATTNKPSFERSHQIQRTMSESERSSSPEKPDKLRDELVLKGKRFNAYYKKYRDLHDRLAGIPPKDRDAKDTDNLWIMHRRLEDMKTEIWSGWEGMENGT
ncbi:uncharacterized protein AB675_5907 [Cyphellophora attinorum]|uniref:Uncharacterized protein n=1 Tax=Cyphellophora attinorum TaxID=1664694 RepID=A0A0N0NL46_9EURO|nr:uncharacterized protein AB675_5907 [Phialophora attinorum]KPI38758.1 hypothetical protein AB675_5907 [Phialophora attinorum]